jgi:hypothetical protein
MIEFSDKQRATRVYRRDEVTREATPLATINKASLQIVEDPQVVISEDETSQISEFVALQRDADVLQQRVWVIRLPAYLREAVSYCERNGSELEIKILADAIATAHSQMRRLAMTKRPASHAAGSRT